MAERIAQFLELAKLVDPQDHTAIKALADAEKVWLYANNSSELTVAKKLYPRYRAALRDAGLVRGKYYKDHGEPWLLHMAPDKDRLKEYNAAYNKHRGEIKRGGQQPIHNTTALLNQGLTLLENDSTHAVVAGLCMLTGRREAEIGISAQFVPCPDDPIHCSFYGQLKRGTEGRLTEIKNVPIWGQREVVLAGLARLRQQTRWHKVYTPAQFDASVAPTIREKVAEYFTPLFPGCTLPMSAHTLRKAYAAISEHYCDHPGYSEDGYIASIMGHSLEDDRSVGAYQHFYVVEEH